MRVCVLGLGYIGFPTACVVASAGHEVVGVDINTELVDRLRNGGIHIANENGLQALARDVLSRGRLKVTTAPESADVFIIAVPTPFVNGALASRDNSAIDPTNYRADLSYVRAASLSIAPEVRPGNLVVLESTVPPGTTERVVKACLEDEGVDTRTVLFAHAPERVLPGNILHELVHNDRVVGGLTQEAGEAAARFYRTFVKGDVATTDAVTAELVKLMENTFRDVNIALANEFALVSERLGIDVWAAIRLANRHPRVKILKPGPGVGGHCIAVDPYFVMEVAPEITRIIRAAREVNHRMPLHVVDMLKRLASGIELRAAAILGASYKASVGDDRESPALRVAAMLEEAGLAVHVHDPYISRYNCPLEQVVAGADAILLLTDHSYYQQVDPAALGSIMTHRLVVDARGVIDVPRWERAGFRVAQLGVGHCETVIART